MATIIGIDPDAEKSGWAVVADGRVMECSSLAFPLLIKRLEDYAPTTTRIVVEAGWLNQSVWHGAYGKGVRVAAKIGRNTGENFQTGKLIVEMAEYLGFTIELVKPLSKHWKGKDGKITADELEKITGWSGRSNQDGRDAVLLAWTRRQ